MGGSDFLRLGLSGDYLVNARPRLFYYSPGESGGIEVDHFCSVRHNGNERGECLVTMSISIDLCSSFLSVAISPSQNPGS